MSHDFNPFERYCRLTCEGGSEAGACPCERPVDCHLRSALGYAEAREAAKQRMFEYLANAIKDTPVGQALADRGALLPKPTAIDEPN